MLSGNITANCISQWGHDFRPSYVKLRDAVEMLGNPTVVALTGKSACVIFNSKIFGQALARVLECQQAKVVAAHADDVDLKTKTSQADLLITAVGKPEFIKQDMVKKDAVVIDIGITKKDGKIRGDVDFEDVKDKVGYITPVPGGVGPLTIAMAFKNTLELYKRKREKKL